MLIQSNNPQTSPQYVSNAEPPTTCEIVGSWSANIVEKIINPLRAQSPVKERFAQNAKAATTTLLVISNTSLKE
jgi:hypothetical protein